MPDARPRDAKKTTVSGTLLAAGRSVVPTGSTGPVGSGATDDDWRQTLPADWTAPGRDADGEEAQLPLRSHPALAKYASKDEAIKALVHAQRLLGKKSGTLLGMGAEPPAATVPDAPAGYELPDMDLPEGFAICEPLRDAFLDKAHELGLTNDQVAGLFAWFVPLNVQGAREADTRRETDRQLSRERQLAALRQVHGGAVAGVLEAARKAVLALGGKELMRRLEQNGAADDAGVIQAFARVAPLVSESVVKTPGSGAQGVTPQRLREMMRDPRYFDPSRRDGDFVRQVREGFECLYPGEAPRQDQPRGRG